jgi:hypothetical protein
VNQQLVASVLPLCLLNNLIRYLTDNYTEWLGIASCGASLIASIGLVWLSTAEHKRSIRPSSFTVLYLFVTCVWDVFALTYDDFFDDRNGSKNDIVFVLATRLVILTLECQEKTSILSSKYRNLSPEETAGWLSSLFFWWMNGLLSRGNRSILRGSHLPRLEKKLEAGSLRRDILLSWDNRGKLKFPMGAHGVRSYGFMFSSDSL